MAPPGAALHHRPQTFTTTGPRGGHVKKRFGGPRGPLVRPPVAPLHIAWPTTRYTPFRCFMAKKKNQQEATATAVAEQPAPDLAPQPDPAPAPVAPNLADLDIVGGLGGIATAPTSRRKTGPVPGVNPKALARAFVAGKVLAKHGHANGCPDELVAEVDAAYGKANAIESGICLRNAWHALRGYMLAGGKLEDLYGYVAPAAELAPAAGEAPAQTE
jgi:hypothetical protein